MPEVASSVEPSSPLPEPTSTSTAGPTVEPEIHEYPAKPGDIYLLCSDGLCDMVEDEDIGMTLQALGGNLKLAAQQLVQMANDNGGRDNVSVILVRVLREYPGTRGVMGKVFGWLK